MRAIFLPRSGKQGFSMLQTVLVFPVFLLLVAGMMQAMTAERTDVLLRTAADNAASEYAVLLAAVDSVQSMRFAERLLPGTVDETRRILTECLVQAGAAVLGADWLRNRTLTWASDMSGSEPCLKHVHGLAVSLEGSVSECAWYARITYRFRTLLGDTRRSFYTHIPIRSGFRWLHTGSGADEEDGIWALNNLERGRLFRERNGGNLPMGYPVLSGYAGGTATVIRSMDTTASGWQDGEAVATELMEEVDALRAFDGTDRPWGRDRIWIRPEDIQARELILVIPEDELSAGTASGLERAVQHAASCGISMDIRRQGRVDPDAP